MPMATESQLLYLEPDDEITSVVRRLRETDAPRVVLVASGRTKATTSAVALRLLAQVAAEEGREVVLVADPFARALAGEAGIPAFSSVSDANADGAVPLEPAAPRRAPIHVVRGEPVLAAPPPALAPPPQMQPAASSGDETQAVRLPPPAPEPLRPRPRRLVRRQLPRAAIGALVALLLLAGGALAAVLPAATITIRPATVPVGPVRYDIELVVPGPDEGVISVTQPGTATGDQPVLTPAGGSVVFLNYSYVTVEVPQGTRVSAGGDVFFTTVERVVAPPGDLVGSGIVPGQVSVGVAAEVAGLGGNVAAEAIDTVENRNVDRFLQGFPSQRGRRVINPEATAGGTEDHLPVIKQEDVDAVIAQMMPLFQEGLDRVLAADPARLYPPMDPPAPVIDVPDGLVGSQGQATFELSGTLTYAAPYVLRADVEAKARAQLMADGDAASSGTTLLPETIAVDLGPATLNGLGVSVQVTVRAEAAPDIDTDQLRELAAGKTAEEVSAALDELGDVTVRLWPDWVDRVPRLDWRIQIDLAAPVGESPSGSAAPAPSG
ncbi:MAG TPA: baseplate J/gp47 family protein [Candidatus Limnocylindria bacterium]